MTGLLVALTLGQAPSPAQPIVLPAIISRWKLPGDEEKAEITIEELQRKERSTRGEVR